MWEFEDYDQEVLSIYKDYQVTGVWSHLEEIIENPMAENPGSDYYRVHFLSGEEGKILSTFQGTTLEEGQDKITYDFLRNLDPGQIPMPEILAT